MSSGNSVVIILVDKTGRLLDAFKQKDAPAHWMVPIFSGKYLGLQNIECAAYLDDVKVKIFERKRKIPNERIYIYEEEK